MIILLAAISTRVLRKWKLSSLWTWICRDLDTGSRYNAKLENLKNIYSKFSVLITLLRRTRLSPDGRSDLSIRSLRTARSGIYRFRWRIYSCCVSCWNVFKLLYSARLKSSDCTIPSKRAFEKQSGKTNQVVFQS